MDFTQLIDQEEEILNERWESPIFRLWKADVISAVAPLGKEIERVAGHSFDHVIIMGRNEENKRRQDESVREVVKLLKTLANRQPKAAQPEISNESLESKTADSIKERVGSGSMTFNNSSINFGDNSVINHIVVKDVLVAAIGEAERTLDDGPEKLKIISALKAITENPTFAAIAGAAIPTLLNGLLTANSPK